jgi:hypothetical protein
LAMHVAFQGWTSTIPSSTATIVAVSPGCNGPRCASLVIPPAYPLARHRQYSKCVLREILLKPYTHTRTHTHTHIHKHLLSHTCIFSLSPTPSSSLCSHTHSTTYTRLHTLPRVSPAGLSAA